MYMRHVASAGQSIKLHTAADIQKLSAVNHHMPCGLAYLVSQVVFTNLSTGTLTRMCSEQWSQPQHTK